MKIMIADGPAEQKDLVWVAQYNPSNPEMGLVRGRIINWTSQLVEVTHSLDSNHFTGYLSEKIFHSQRQALMALASQLEHQALELEAKAAYYIRCAEGYQAASEELPGD